jgi:superfamily II DNA helicase RecQ
MYDKARKRRGNSEYIIRSLPDQVSQILAQYLVFVRPFARALDQRESEFLFADKRGPWAGEQLSRELAKATNKHLGVRLVVSAWRHIAIGIAVQHLMHSSKVWEKDEDQEDQQDEFAEGDDEEELEANTFDHIVVRQSGHGQRIAQAHYAVDGSFLHRLGPQLISAFERASITWHELFGWKSDGSDHRTKVEDDITKVNNDSTKGTRNITKKEKHGRQASQQLGPVVVKKERIQLRPSQATDRFVQSISPAGLVKSSSGVSKAMIGLQRIHGPRSKPQSEGQASALELVHDPPKTSIIVLPTSSGKSVLFFSVAAMAVRQTVIVVVPFRALVDDIIVRGFSHGLDCEEWIHEGSCHDIQQLVIVSADQAVSPEFLHWAKGLELHEQLAHVFFDEGHVAFTDRSYRTKLRDLWKLRYLDCPFTVLTATLMIKLEDKLREQLLIPDAILFRRITVRPRIQYKVINSQGEMPSKVATQLIQKLGQLPDGKKGIIYVRSYATGEQISKEVKCPFYKATAEQKSELLDEWMQGNGGWIVATGALGTGINIQGIIYVIHVDRPYGLTSFAQQSGRGGRDGDISQSIIVVNVQNTSPYKRSGVMSVYSTEQIDEEAMTEFIQTKGCRRMILGRYFDGEEHGSIDCRQMDWVFCDFCNVRSHQERVLKLLEEQGEEQEQGKDEDQDQGAGSDKEISGRELIIKASYEAEESEEQMFKVMEELKEQCIYCMLIRGESNRWKMSEGEGAHLYEDCSEAKSKGCGVLDYKQWRSKIDLGAGQDCYKCGLSQRVCKWTEDGTQCQYPGITIPGIFILYRSGGLAGAVDIIGFQGSYEKDIWDWMREMDEGVRSVRESNWMKTWRQVCLLYLIMKGG